MFVEPADTTRCSAGSNGSAKANEAATSPMHAADETLVPVPAPIREVIDISQIIVPPSGSETGERESDIYSVHSEDIPEHDDMDEDDDQLQGDGSKPVGCSSCAVM